MSFANMDAQLTEFNTLCTSESFKEVWRYYGFGTEQQKLIHEEFTRIKGITYLDHAGTTLFPESQVKAFYQDISRNVYGNPHSHNPSSKLTHDTVERVRYRILEHFNTSPEEYTVIFTSGCTAALKLVATSFPWRIGPDREARSRFCYLTDNHTSVVGIRGVTGPLGVDSVPVTPQEMESRSKPLPQAADDDHQSDHAFHLFCFPAQSNFSGRKYPLGLVRDTQSRRAYPGCGHPGRWLVLLDASCLVGCSPLDLTEHPADFVPISFYKMFGFPTGLGALLVRNEVAGILRKDYFGGGTAAAYLAGEDYFVPKLSIADRFEDGTISFLDIISLHHGFDTLHRLTGNMINIQLHTFGLARYTYVVLSCLRHGNRQPVAQIYCDSEFQDPSTQGAVLNFNLLDCHGNMIGYSQVNKMASLFNIHIRTGCFCNTGACQAYLGLKDQQVKSNFQAGHVCGDDVDIVDGLPTGSVRVSFGYMSTFEDCQEFLKFVVNCFVDKPLRVDQKRLARLKLAIPNENSCDGVQPVATLANGYAECEERGPPSFTALPYEEHAEELGCEEAKARYEDQTLTNIFIYPIKSCAAFEVSEWPLGQRGLLYDRMWMLVNENGVCLSQKREPSLCLIRPHVCLTTGMLRIQAPGMDPIAIPLEVSDDQCLRLRTCQSKVCGDRVQTVDCGDEVASQLSAFLRKPCRLIKQSPDFSRDKKTSRGKEESSTALSLVNEAQYLLINRASVCLLRDTISKRQDDSNGDQPFDTQHLIQRFRANLVISAREPFVEDDWSELLIGRTQFQVAGRCGRCQMIGVDQTTGSRTQEPLRSLSEYRNGKLTFGVYLQQQPLKNSVVPTLCVGALVHPKRLNSEHCP